MCQWDAANKRSLKRAEWGLACLSSVHVPRIWSASDLAQMPIVGRHAVAYCAHAPDDQTQFEAGTWYGVPVTALLDESRPLASARSAQFISLSGASVTLPLSALGDAVIALPSQTDPAIPFDARLIVPGLPVCQMLHGLSRIVVQEATAPALPSLPTRAWVTDVLPHAVTGLAFHGVDGLTGVAVRLNHGPAVHLGMTGRAGAFTRWTLPLPPGYAGRPHAAVTAVSSAVLA
ncbi:MAG: hypothetical protein KME04_03850 [Pleurocapsa minor GSE-CHR-MK-17-07R]|jgi:DMSO/TMAO reductase YedYZ molybdopterin-dependent catalytic subunit|nr:hypothetical protein [Pleurocapsa minor GSE-CHR-MK 17-07R]